MSYLQGLVDLGEEGLLGALSHVTPRHLLPLHQPDIVSGTVAQDFSA
jgi:hypothetical protein